MSERRFKTDWLVIPGILLLLVLATAGIYTGAYFLRGTYSKVFSVSTGYAPPRMPQAIVRQYPTQWEASLFQPGAKVESWLTGHPVSIYSLLDFDFGGPTDLDLPYIDDSAP